MNRFRSLVPHAQLLIGALSLLAMTLAGSAGAHWN
jgi:hypothetical protein